MEILVPISLGELYDKISILEIKKEKIDDPLKLQNIEKELELLLTNRVWRKHKLDAVLFDHIRHINERLWDVEDEIRIEEKNKTWGEDFINLARNVYRLNDERAQVKRLINENYGSSIVEEKSYEKYK